MWLPLTRPLLGTWPETQGCALTGNQSSDPLVRSPSSIHGATSARACHTNFKYISPLYGHRKHNLNCQHPGTSSLGSDSMHGGSTNFVLSCPGGVWSSWIDMVHLPGALILLEDLEKKKNNHFNLLFNMLPILYLLCCEASKILH